MFSCLDSFTQELLNKLYVCSLRLFSSNIAHLSVLVFCTCILPIKYVSFCKICRKDICLILLLVLSYSQFVHVDFYKFCCYFLLFCLFRQLKVFKTVQSFWFCFCNNYYFNLQTIIMVLFYELLSHFNHCKIILVF